MRWKLPPTQSSESLEEVYEGHLGWAPENDSKKTEVHEIKGSHLVPVRCRGAIGLGASPTHSGGHPRQKSPSYLQH